MSGPDTIREALNNVAVPCICREDEEGVRVTASMCKAHGDNPMRERAFDALDALVGEVAAKDAHIEEMQRSLDVSHIQALNDGEKILAYEVRMGAAEREVAALKDLLYECEVTFAKHEDWCGFNKDAPGDGIFWRTRDKVREALSVSPPPPQQKLKDGDRDEDWPEGFYWSDEYERPVYRPKVAGEVSAAGRNPQSPEGAVERADGLRQPYSPVSPPPPASERDAADWKDALELGYLWAGYWEDEPSVHIHTGKVGFLARSFLFAMAHFGVIQQPRAASDAGSQKDIEEKCDCLDGGHRVEGTNVCMCGERMPG